MAEDDDNDSPATIDWGEDANTTLDAPAVEEFSDEPVTEPHAVQELPGFEVGLLLGERRGIAKAMEALRVDLIQKGGIDPGVAAMAAHNLGRLCGLRYH